jgi:hypothetical protein
MEHYADDLFENIVPDKHMEECCFICLSVEVDDELCPMKLGDNNLYIRKCRCIGFIHQKCLDTWFYMNSKCPICRLYMKKRAIGPAGSVFRQTFGMNLFCIFLFRNICKIIWLTSVVIITMRVFMVYTSGQYNHDAQICNNE